MTIRRYLEPGAFSPAAIPAMNEAFEGVVTALDIGPEDETTRECVAQLIVELSRRYGAFDAAMLRDEAMKVLGGKGQK
jgi:hypothetical protein